MIDITALSDHELLVLAAKYCGHEIPLGETREFMVRKPGEDFFVVWNPLIDAGDRALMCDELGFSLDHHNTCCMVTPGRRPVTQTNKPSIAVFIYGFSSTCPAAFG